MAVKIRLTRMGAKKAPFYRIVVVDSRNARDSQYIEQLGYYNPVSVPSELKIDNEKAKKWLDEGAQPTEVIRSLFKNAGIIERTSVKAEVKLKLVKMGKKKAEYYGIVAVDTTKTPTQTEKIGEYNPAAKADQFKLDKEKYDKYVSGGAKVSAMLKELVAKNA